MRDMVRAVGIKGSVQRTAVGIPSFSKVMPSCKLHDEQEPQSPLEVTKTSQLDANSLTMCSGAFPLAYNSGKISRATFRLTVLSSTNLSKLTKRSGLTGELAAW